MGGWEVGSQVRTRVVRLRVGVIYLGVLGAGLGFWGLYIYDGRVRVPVIFLSLYLLNR